jgi:hypothetical protein
MATIYLNTAANDTEEFVLPVNNISGETVELLILTYSLSGGTIDWGDGTIESISHNSDLIHVLTSDITEITLTLDNGLEDLKRFESFNNSLKITGSYSVFKNFPNIEELHLSNNFLSDNISSLPSTLKELTMDGNLIGNVVELPPNLTHFIILNSIYNNDVRFFTSFKLFYSFLELF